MGSGDIFGMSADCWCRSVSRIGLSEKAAQNVRYMRYMSEYTDRSIIAGVWLLIAFFSQFH